MHRLSLACLMLMIAAFTLPASGRGFRTDLFTCDVPDAPFYCWGGPFPSDATVALPTDNTTGPFTPNTSGLSVNPSVFTHKGFVFTAFDYAQFLSDIGNPTGSGLSAPTVEVTRGFSRVTSVADTPFEDTDAPLLRINWLFDPALESFSNIFEADQFINGTHYFGVQLIFYGDGSGSFNQVASGAGFELNGLKAGGQKYSFSTQGGDSVWSGATQPCSTFNNSGICIRAGAVPEPSSLALLGLGFLALTSALRTRTRARAAAA